MDGVDARPPVHDSAPPVRRRADIQGLRAVAVLLVVAFHAGLPVPGGFVGVDVFFVISGFVITGSLTAELAAGGSLSLRRFYARRARRLLPALGVMLSVVALLSMFAAPFGAQRMAAITTGAAALFGANIYLLSLGAGYFDVATTLNPLLHTWTLAVEEQFYIVFPCALAVAWRFGRRRGALAAISALTIASFLLSLELSARGGAAGRIAFYSSPTRAWEFGLGALLAIAPATARRLPVAAAAVGGLVGAALIDFAATSLHGTDGFPGTQALYPAIGAALLIATGGIVGAPLSRFLSTRPLIAVGNLSYSWYLWHWPLIVFASALLPRSGWAAPAAAVLSAAPAYASYRLLENPIRRGVALRRVRAGRLAAVCVVVPLVAATALGAVHISLGQNARFADLVRSQRLHEDVTRGCDSPTPLGERTGGLCTWRVSHPRGTVVLVGDSNAGQFTEAFTRAANSDGYTATVATQSSCPFSVLRMREDGALRDDSNCGGFVSGTLRTLADTKPSLVVIASRTDKYLRTHSIALGITGGASLAHGAEAKARDFEQGLETVLRTLNNRGIPVLVVHAIPRLPFQPSRCSVASVLRGTCSGERTRRAVNAELAVADDVENDAVGSASTTWALRFEDRLCGVTTCLTSRNGVAMYRDEDHLSIAGSLTLTNEFAKVIQRRARPAR